MVTQNNYYNNYNNNIIQHSIMLCGDLSSSFEIPIDKHMQISKNQNYSAHFSTPLKQRRSELQISGREKRQRAQKIQKIQREQKDIFICEKVSGGKENIFKDISKFIRKRGCNRCGCCFCECS
jgi:type IV secretory pathway ATPase VirB11/archaellum biosynthesis ATPase